MSSDHSDAPSRRSWVPLALALLLGLAIGLGATVLLDGSQPTPTQSENEEGNPPAATNPASEDESRAELPAPDTVVPADRATDPETAIRGYLAAEAAMDWETSYAFLTAELREVAYPTAAVWVAAHADFPSVAAYRIEEVTVEGSEATVRTLTGFRPALDRVIGLVAARGRTTWVLRQESDGLWRVDTTSSENMPLYPSEEGVEESVRAWLEARVACEDSSHLEEGLIGVPALADALCGETQPADIVVGGPRALSSADDTAALLNAWGPEVFAWARAVEIGAASPFDAIVAPLGEDWRVVAILG